MCILLQLDIDVEAYFASEVDQDAIMVTRVRHPNVTHIGDVMQLDAKKVGTCDKCLRCNLIKRLRSMSSMWMTRMFCCVPVQGFGYPCCIPNIISM